MGVGGGGRVLPPSLPAPLRESIKLDCLQFSEPSGAGEPTGRVPGALAPELQHWANSTLATLKHHHLAPPTPCLLWAGIASPWVPFSYANQRVREALQTAW